MLKNLAMHKFLKNIIFLSDPEFAHNMTIKFLQIPGAKQFLRLICEPEKYNLTTTAFGLKFLNPLGLAAGFDKDAQAIEALSNLGFGFIEIGTVTPKPQPGNPKPRLFRLIEDQAIINRMGFNNYGVQQIIKNIKQTKNTKSVLGINLGKNKTTINEDAVQDYLYGFTNLFPYGDYFVINVSSPNTPKLRELQSKEKLNQIFSALQEFNSSQPTPKPLLVKIAPDLGWQEIDDILDVINLNNLSGIIATNTTIQRPQTLKSPVHLTKQTGGLSGAPLSSRSTEIIRYIYKHTQGNLPIIGVGGIITPADALEKLEAGASLIQIYTGMIYNGPCFVKQLKQFLYQKLNKNI